MADNRNDFATEGVAIIGLGLRVPGARDAERFWDNLRRGVESISHWSEEELLRAGVDADTLRTPGYVRASGMIDDVACFDAAFFGCTPREAELMDPQHRHFLECAWEALEDAGCDPARYPGRIGVFAGAGASGYLLNIQAAHGLPPEQLLQLSMGSFSDYLTTRLSYKLDLRGPSLGVQTACSTSLVAVHLACLHLLAGQCEVALAGGVTLRAAEAGGYLYQEGGIFSPDGHCRPFAARAAGTVEGNGVGVVVLKRLEDALADGDPIRAVIRGTAVNNDGAQKAGFTTPGVDGQAEVISLAHAMAEVEPDTITYLEAHGTGTPLGDPIEIAAITQAFRRRTPATGFCAIGSVKGNLGHLDAAAGVAGLIKTVLALEHRQLPPTLHCESPNPLIDFARSPVRPQTELAEWKTPGFPRRAGVSSFGIGGTNAHVVLEEAPPLADSPASRPGRPRLLVLSARTAPALERMTRRLGEHLHRHPELDLGAVAYTLQTGRRRFPHRRVLVSGDVAHAADLLRSDAPRRLHTAVREATERPVAFLFSGQGSQYVDMARGLRDTEPLFRERVDRCAELLRPLLAGVDPREVLFPEPARRPEAEARLTQTRFAQPALFVVEYALAELLDSWGVKPAAMLGHSLGEYVAACRAGVMELADALRLVALRGELMQRLPTGGMLSVPLAAAALEPRLGPRLSLAAVNGPALCTVAGPLEELARLREELTVRGVEASPLRTSHAFHSWMMEPALKPFLEGFQRVTLRPPTAPFLSNVTGTWIRSSEATDPGYWARHLRQPVRFDDGLRALFQRPDLVLLEVGPGTTLSTLALRHPERPPAQPVFSLLRHPRSTEPDERVALETLGALWAEGVPLDAAGLHGGAPPRRVPLPAYPFERTRYWIAPPRSTPAPQGALPLEERALPGEPVFPSPTEERQRPPLETPFVAPRNDLEQRVARLWSECLGYAGIGVEDDFLALGGDSLVAAQLVSRLRQAFPGAAPSLRQLFDAPTIAGVAACIASATPGGASADAPPSAPPDTGEVHPLSYAQQRLWVLEQLLPGSAAYHLPQCLRLRGPLEHAVLERALGELVQRHEALRTTFVREQGEPVQRVRPASGFTLPREDLRAHPRAGREALARERAWEETQRPFDLERGPLFRARLLTLDDEDHLLVLTLHHLVADGWSMNVLRQELTASYLALRSGRPAALPPLALQYGACARRQRESLRGPVLEAELAWWKQQLAGLRALELPTDRPRPAVQSLRGAVHGFTLGAEQSRELDEFSRREGLTPFMTCLAAFSAVLGRHAGTRDVSVGTPVAGRDSASLEGVIGLFVNTLVLRTDLSGQPTGRELLRRVRETTLSAWSHQALPFEKVVAALDPQRDLSRSPLFRVMLAFEAGTLEKTALGGLELELVPLTSRSAQFDLTLVLTRTSQGYAGQFEYCADLFEPDTLATLERHFTRMLRALVHQPDTRVDEHALLSKEELPGLLERCLGRSTPVPSGGVHTFIAARAAETPRALALVQGSREVTYGELERRANQLAHRLRRLGITREVPVGLCLERSPELVVAVLAVLKAGGCYLPLDPAYPDERLRWLLSDTGAPVVITEPALRERLSAPGHQVLCVDDEAEAPGRAPDTSPDVPVLDGQPAYLTYTSGSTGPPKAVIVPHRALLNHARAMVEDYALGARDRVLQFASFTFDVAAEELFPSLMAGAAVVLRHERRTSAISDFVRFLRSEAITVANLPAPYWHEWADALGRNPDHAPPPALRLVVAGSQAVSPERLVVWRRHAPDVRWMNAYGPTEATITATVYEETGARAAPGERVPIGRPIANAEAYVLDERLRPVPLGVEGEIFLGGEGLARGYLRRPELTANAFIPHPFSRVPGARLYRTGDRGRYRRDGQLEILGRGDGQVKVRGFRIELGEIEAALQRQPGVAEAVVLYQDGPGGDGRLDAYLEPVAGERLTEELLWERLRARLPPHMLPSTVAALEKLPRTPGGKTDRAALRAHAPGRLARVARVPPATPMERAMARLWAEVLKSEEPGIHDDFFHLGGDSLLAIRLVGRANEEGLGLTVRELFEHPTIAELAPRAGQGPAGPSTTGSGASMPLAPAQRRFFEQAHANPHHWNRSLLVEVDEPLEATSLREAVRRVERHHDALRLRFTPTADGWSQRVAELSDDVPFSREDLSGVSTGELDAAVTAAATRTQGALHLEHGPLWRVALLELGPGRGQRLLVVVHFLVADAFSWTLLLEDLQTAYAQLRHGAPVQLPARTAPFHAWTEEVVAYARSERLRSEASYWRDALGGVLATLPVDNPSGANTEGSLRTVRTLLPPDDSRTLVRELPAQLRVEAESVLLSGLAQALCPWVGPAPLLVDLGRHGRQATVTALDLSRTVGCFTTDCPVRLEAPMGGDLQAVRHLDEALRRIPDRGFGYGVLRHVHDGPELSARMRALPRASVSFDYLGSPVLSEDDAFRLARESAGLDRCPDSQRTHVLQVIATVVDGRLELLWRYSEALHARATVERLATRLTTALAELAARFRALPAFPEGDRTA